ncbi:flavin prenyltransferase UbiX [Candidatus Oleimmundimicrobium sp.]|uniref:UbiX family flavin prenyltransferase n=1 Tax=Candidatus Oleimmundimicrobium sp. TaxID=3060597 RepID=UPI0027168EF0|nr:flavin prenyltransferase UbiX [Candidatus Oleimmundimicrobium sp.]MDO8885912.1 flavin prenyltransferase UbiX [Candidatus Oleimmundimicrobium sp.]
MKFIVGVTGASGAVYAERLLRELLLGNHEVKLLITDTAKDIMAYELDFKLKEKQNEAQKQLREWMGLDFADERLEYIEISDLNSSICSGSYKVDGMIIIPCSMATLAAVKSGMSSNLLERAADVTLKERRPLIVVPRETPLNEIHLKNMLSLHRAGAFIVPAVPGFYHRPESIDDLVCFVVGRVFDVLGLEHNLYRRWNT